MSGHWTPDGDRTRWTRADGYAPLDGYTLPVKSSWPKGATPGVLMVAAICLAIAALLYKAAGPRDPIEKNSAIDWSKVDLPNPHD